MSVFKQKASSGGGDFEVVPAGSHPAILCGIIDVGTQSKTFQGKTESYRKVFMIWELPGEKKQDGTSHVIGRMYTLSMNKKAGLRALVEKWRGKPLADEEEFDLTVLLGKKCLVAVGHQSSGDNTFAKHDGVSPLPKGMTVPAGTITPVLWEIESGKPMPDTGWMPYSYGEPIDVIIKRSPEWAERESGKNGQHQPVGATAGPSGDEDEMGF